MVEVKGKLEDILNRFNSRLEHVESKLDMLDSDRAIFENIQGRLTSLEEQWKMTREHDVAVKKDIKEEINLVGDKTVAKVETKLEQVQGLIKDRRPHKAKKGIITTIFGRLKRR